VDPTQPIKNWKISTQPNPWVNPTHGQLWDGQTNDDSKYRANIASRGKNDNISCLDGATLPWTVGRIFHLSVQKAFLSPAVSKYTV